MGDKIESKLIAIDAGVATIPGHAQALADEDEAVQVADGVGYPRHAQGVGRRRRQGNAHRPGRGTRSATGSARRQARPGRVSVTTGCLSNATSRIRAISRSRSLPIITEPVLYLGERGVLDPAPSPEASSRKPRARFSTRIPVPGLGAQAVALARAVDYRSAGTVEFVVGPRPGTSNFLEMNTRLQVEASGHRTRHRPRPCRTDDPHRLRRAAAFLPGRRTAGRLGDRGPDLRRGSLPGIPAVDRAPCPDFRPPRDRRRCPHRHRGSPREPRSRCSTIR